MNLLKLIFRNTWYYRKKHLAVFIGTVISTAILTGALIIGDSVKYSLGSLVDKRLGNIEFAMQTGDRFVSNELAQKLGEKLKVPATSLLMLDGIAIESNASKRINKTQIIGVNKDFWKLSGITLKELKSDDAIISSNLAERLNLKIGDDFLVRVEKAHFIPANAPFTKEDESSVAMRLSIKAIATNDQLGRFSLQNNQSAPYNVFISKEYLAEQMDLFGYSNVIVLANNMEKSLDESNIQNALKECWSLKDAGIDIRQAEKNRMFEIRTKRIFLEQSVIDNLAHLSGAKEDIISYLVNSLKANQKETPYSFASGISSLNHELKDDEVIINDWLAKDLNLKKGQKLEVSYYVIGPMRKLKEESRSFVVKKIIKTGNRFHTDLMPEFPGLSDANSCNEWETGIPIDLEKIRDKDEKYWDDHKGTPKIVLNYHIASKIWGNRFGNHTALRINTNGKKFEDFKKEVLASLKPEDLKLVFLPSRKIGESAVNNAVSFGELFLSLSFFVIVAGVLLTAMLYSLSLESRQSEFGILAACGFSRAKILRIQVSESILITILGGILGALLGICYNYGLMSGINSIWMDIVRTNELEIYLIPQTLITGALSGIFISFIVIFFINRKKLKNPIIGLIKNSSIFKPKQKRKKNIIPVLLIISILGLSAILFFSLSEKDTNAGNFMMAGSLFLLVSFLSLKLFLNRSKHQENDYLTLKRLSVRNIALNQGRSLTVIILLALGTFTIVITGANRKTFYGLENNAQSGSGGYLYWAESTLPILHDLNTKTDIADKAEYFKNNDVSFVQFHRLEGDDASCLNLNQVSQPKILGIDPNIFEQKKAFSFAKLDQGIEFSNAWLELEKTYGENIIPAYADQTVITWGLKMKVGDTLIYLSEAGKEIKMVLKGGLNASIFQGHLLIGDKHFTKYFPSISGSRTLLVDAPITEEKNVQLFFNENYLDYGIELQKATDRLAEFNSVTNTYLFIFMILGGLGVLIGTIGLGIILLRNISDRKKEIAVMQAIGYFSSRISKLIFIENFMLLITGIIIGLLGAFIGILPSLISKAFDMQLEFIFGILLLIILNGICWIYFTAKVQMKKIIIQELQKE